MDSPWQHPAWIAFAVAWLALTAGTPLLFLRQGWAWVLPLYWLALLVFPLILFALGPLHVWVLFGVTVYVLARAARRRIARAQQSSVP